MGFTGATACESPDIPHADIFQIPNGVFSLQLVPSCADADWEMGMQNPSASENDSNRAASNRLTLRVMVPVWTGND